jgi:rRNA maturation endonuclease Nob1
MRLDQSVMWEVFPTVVFTYATCGSKTNGENFFWTTPKTEISENTLSHLFRGAYSFKEIYLNLGLRKIAVVGTGETSRLIRVQCPYCFEVQELIDESQVCSICNKRFYIY